MKFVEIAATPRYGKLERLVNSAYEGLMAKSPKFREKFPPEKEEEAKDYLQMEFEIDDWGDLDGPIWHKLPHWAALTTVVRWVISALGEPGKETDYISDEELKFERMHRKVMGWPTDF